MELRWVSDEGVCVRPPAEVGELLGREDGFVWVDVPQWDEEAEALLAGTFGAHPLALAHTRERNHIALVHRYPGHLFIAIHAPKIGARGHVHYLELDQYIGERFLVTVHGPLNPVVPLEDALRETREVADRMERGRLRPSSPFALTYAIVSTIVRHESDLVNELAREVGLLEQAVTSAVDEEPQEFLGKLFMARHELLTVKTMATQAGEIYRRAVSIVDFAPPDGLQQMRDVLDQYERVASIAQSQLEFLQGVTEFYRARTDTKMTIAGEKLAVIAALTLPVTAISSVMGMNVIVNESTHWPLLIVLLALMFTLAMLLLRWAKRQGWW
ncbi:Mg2+ and Co2+ transporter CorA [Microlunatus flavus]|uniref:Mg2+ and Co2+ transporter CorA n=1 Tax=Microlunatus flavus TaxID=1036181 RepID=A0A1H9KYG4_9ACTN|nr:Mg2+ and Co2+ transporter CorA [Microlunatus flavus]